MCLPGTSLGVGSFVPRAPLEDRGVATLSALREREAIRDPLVHLCQLRDIHTESESSVSFIPVRPEGNHVSERVETMALQHQENFVSKVGGDGPNFREAGNWCTDMGERV